MIDFHTHGPNPLATHYIQVLNNYSDNNIVDSGFCLGIHPWEAESFNPLDFEKDLLSAKCSDKFKGLGEIGLDKIKGPCIETQMEVFKSQLYLVKKHEIRTIIIHCVKMHNEVLNELTRLNFKGNLILHDFHGHLQLIKQYNAQTKTYISVGKNFLKTQKNKKIIEELGPKNILLETDDNENCLLEQSYTKLSDLLKIEQSELLKAHFEVFNSL
jgi:TatD DNase family protein